MNMLFSEPFLRTENAANVYAAGMILCLEVSSGQSQEENSAD